VEVTAEELEWFFATVLPHMNERQRRVVSGATALMIGHGGKARVADTSGLARNTVIRAAREIESGLEVTDRQRGRGGGDKKAIDKQPGLLEALDELVHPDTRGNPMSFVRWTSKSTYDLADELARQGFQVSPELVRRLLHEMGYSLQAPSKQKEGTAHPDRDAQFQYLNGAIADFAKTDDPAISVDTKKKELVGEYDNNGREWQPKGEPVEVLDHDFVNPEMGKAVPYGVYDLTNDEGWVSVGENADTAAFAVESIRRWWQHMGAERFPEAERLLITADAGGSNGYRIRAFKVELAKLAKETGLEITVCHYPPGTSKWNKIEHRMFSFISMNWRGRPLTSYRTIVELIAGTTTRKGLRIRAERDQTGYRTKVKISNAELAAVPLRRHDFHGDWNYTIAAT
jgi:transposase